jgi:D-glycero-D-manno-heptose 1,7-bisphosphate phosphatase
MPLVLLDRDGVIVVNSSDNIKRPDQLRLLPGAAEAIGRLTRAGFDVAVCTNQPEVGRGVMSAVELERVHDALHSMLAAQGGRVEIHTCCSVRKCPRRKPAPGMLREALRRHGANAADTAFIGDQADDLVAAFHAGCRPVLVKTGLGRQTLLKGLPAYVGRVAIHDDLAAAADAEIERSRQRLAAAAE